jgi:SAM-dependent methyltransferase
MLRSLADRLAETPLAFHYLRKLPEWNYRATKARLRALAAELGRPAVLDVGCGTGEFASLFDAAGYQGVDIHPGYVRLARRLNPGHRFDCADMQVWPGAGRRFDLVLVNGVLHHLDDDTARGVLRAGLSHALPGARLVVIEDTEIDAAGVGASVVHALDHGHFIRRADDWVRLVSSVVPIERSESYQSGWCPYHLMLAVAP